MTTRTTAAFLSCTLLIATACNHKERVSTASSETSSATTSQVASTKSSSGGEPSTVSTGQVDPATLGIPLYPGAKPAEGGDGVATTGSEGSNQVVFMTTPDSYETVVAWYKSRLPYDGDPVNLGVLATSSFRVGAKDAAEPKFATVTRLNGRTSITLSSGHPSAAATSVASSPSTPGAAALADLSPIGLPLYPNVYESGWTGNFSDDKQATRVGQMSSHDAFDKVYGWYSERMPAGSETKEAAASNHTTDDGDRMALFEVGTTADAEMTRVMLVRDKADDHTIINLSGHSTK